MAAATVMGLRFAARYHTPSLGNSDIGAIVYAPSGIVYSNSNWHDPSSRKVETGTVSTGNFRE